MFGGSGRSSAALDDGRYGGIPMRSLFVLVVGFIAGLVLGVSTAPVSVSNARAQGQDGPQPKETKVGNFQAIKIKKEPGSASALDFHLDGTGRAIRFFVPVWPPKNPPVEQKDPAAYFGDTGQLYTKGWIVISGVSTGTGEGFNIQPPTKDPSMLAVWSDVLGPAIQARSANAGADSYLFQGLDRKAHYTFSIEQDGGLRWGATSRAAMDTNLYRSAAKTLKTDGALVVAGKVGVGTADPVSTLHVRGAQSVQRTAATGDYGVSESDYYLGVTDTAARRTITLPTASGKEGRVYIIKDESGGAGTRPITVKAQPGETIDGAEALTIRASYGVL